MLGNAEIIHALEHKARSIGMCERYHAFGRLVEAGDAVEDRRLAGAIRADECGNVVARRDEGEIADRDKTAEAHGEVLQAQDRITVDQRHQP